MTLTSCLYEGMVRHRRFEPIEFGFRYPIHLLYLDLDEEESAFEGSRLWSTDRRTPVQFRRADHLGSPQTPLAESVRAHLEQKLGHAPQGPIRLLTGPRYFGRTFNPISLYYCFGEDGETLEALLAEVSNTPWGELFCYALDVREREADRESSMDARQRETKKSFHVSPFMEMDMTYDWRVTTPSRHLTLSIRNEWADRAPSPNRAFGVPYFQADLALNRVELNPTTLRRAFLRAPFQSSRIQLAIYRQALRLAWRRVAFVRHPAQSWPRNFDAPELSTPSGLISATELGSPAHEDARS